MFKRVAVIFGLMLVATTSYAWQGWHWQNPLLQGNPLWGVCFTDADTGWVVGEVGTILRTTDGGSTGILRVVELQITSTVSILQMPIPAGW